MGLHKDAITRALAPSDESTTNPERRIAELEREIGETLGRLQAKHEALIESDDALGRLIRECGNLEKERRGLVDRVRVLTEDRDAAARRAEDAEVRRYTEVDERMSLQIAAESALTAERAAHAETRRAMENLNGHFLDKLDLCQAAHRGLSIGDKSREHEDIAERCARVGQELATERAAHAETRRALEAERAALSVIEESAFYQGPSRPTHSGKEIVENARWKAAEARRRIAERGGK